MSRSGGIETPHSTTFDVCLCGDVKESMAQAGAAKTASRSVNKSRRRRPLDDEGIIPILARAVREVESQAARGKVNAQNRTKFQVSALLVREERQRVKDDASVTAEQRAEVLKRLDGLAAIMAKTCLLYTSPSPRDGLLSRMPSSA